MSVARERRIWQNDTLTMSTRKRALFAADKFDEHGVEQLLEEDSDGADLGVACIDYDSTSSSDDAKDQSVPQTPNSWRMTTRSSKRKEKNRSTPLSFESRRRSARKDKLINTPSSSHSFTIDTESCSNSLQDLTFNSDSENSDSKENTPVKTTSRNLRSSKRCSAKNSFDKVSLKTNSKTSSPMSAFTESSNLYRTNPALCGMKTPQENIHHDAPPPRHPHNRRSLQILCDKTSPTNTVSCKKRSCDDMLEVSNPESKSLRNEQVSVPKARHSLFNSDAFKHFISPKSFYTKTSSQTEETPTSFSKSNSVSPNIISKPTNSHLRHVRVYKAYRKKNGEINKGVKHGIRKPKHLKKSKIDVLKMAMDIIENSPLNDYIDKLMKKDTTSPQNSNKGSSLPKNPSLISENQLKKMDAVLQQLGCESSIYKLFHNKTFNNLNKTSTNSCDESMDEADTSEEVILPKDNTNNKFFKSSRNSTQNRTLTVKLPNNIKAQVHNGKISLPKKHLKNSSCFSYNKDIFKTNLGFDASDLMDDDDDISELGDKENINNLINQWDEEEIPLSEPQVHQDFIQVMQNIKDSEDLVSGSASKPADDSINNSNSKEMNTEDSTIQLVPVENGAYLLVEDVDMSDEETQYDIEKIEAELHDLDRKIKIMAEMNNINPEAFISSPKSKEGAPTSVLADLLLPVENEQNISETVNNQNENASSDKVFSIFVKGHKSTIQDDNKATTPKASVKKIARSDHDQYIIDAGQKKIGAIQCSECALIYHIGDPEDEKYHNMHHFSLNILKFQGWKNETISGQWANGTRCILVRPNDPASHWNRVNQLLDEVVNPQLGFAAPLVKEKPYKVYLYIENKMIIGCLVAEPKESANRIMTKDGVDYCSTETYPVKCGVSRIWTHPQHRQKGVATRMMKSLCTSFMYGHVLNNEEVAFSSPTPSGKLFIEKFTKMKNFLIYLE